MFASLLSFLWRVYIKNTVSINIDIIRKIAINIDIIRKIAINIDTKKFSIFPSLTVLSEIGIPTYPKSALHLSPPTNGSETKPNETTNPLPDPKWEGLTTLL